MTFRQLAHVGAYGLVIIRRKLYQGRSSRTLSSTASRSRWQARLRPGLPLRRGSDIPPACPRRAPPSPHRATDEHAPLGNGMVQLRADFNLNNISGSEMRPDVGRKSMTGIDRRRLLKFSGAGAITASTGAVAAILASGRAP